jgi:hypothetical protein
VAGPPEHLAPNCFNFPDEPFGKDNHVKMVYAPPWSPQGGGLTFDLGVNQGDQVGTTIGAGVAPDFSLSTTKGDEVTLSNLLKEKPVFLEFGSFT